VALAQQCLAHNGAAAAAAAAGSPLSICSAWQLSPAALRAGGRRCGRVDACQVPRCVSSRASHGSRASHPVQACARLGPLPRMHTYTKQKAGCVSSVACMPGQMKAACALPVLAASTSCLHRLAAGLVDYSGLGRRSERRRPFGWRPLQVERCPMLPCRTCSILNLHSPSPIRLQPSRGSWCIPGTSQLCSDCKAMVAWARPHPL
jgi:hypothetical protein